jgi:hypothetical protein
VEGSFTAVVGVFYPEKANRIRRKEERNRVEVSPYTTTSSRAV